MFALLRACVVLPLMLAAPAMAQVAELRVCYEEKDTHDHTGEGAAVPDNPGVLVELVSMVQLRVPNLRISFLRRPWVRCLIELEVGRVDAVFSSSFKPERLKMGVYPMRDGKDDRRYRIDSKFYSLYKLVEAPLEWDGTLFTNGVQTVLAMRGYAIVDDLKKMGMPVTEVTSSEGAFRMLLAGRADGFAQLSDVGDYILKKNADFARIVKVTPPITTKDYYLQLSHQFHGSHPELAQKIWKALGELRQSETERLVAKYLKLYAE